MPHPLTTVAFACLPEANAVSALRSPAQRDTPSRGRQARNGFCRADYRLLTTLLDPNVAPALELAALYHQRWQVEAVFDELKTHLLKSRRVLRSKTAELVRQEFYGWVLAHYSVRWLLHQGATRHRMPHAQLSFTSHVQLLRREQPHSGAFPPSEAETATTLVPARAGRKRTAARNADAQPA